MKKIVVIHGPNLNLIGQRQPEIYGKDSLKDIDGEIKALGRQHGFTVTCYQSNIEGEIISLLQKNRKGVAGVVLNPGSYSHTSIGILDALLAMEVPVVEVHLSNIYSREEFRQKSVTARGARGIISGFGKQSYLLAVKYLIDLYKE